MGQHRIAIRLACALLVGGLIWPGAPASAAEVSADQIIRALTAAPKTRGLSAREAPVQSEAERSFVESLRHRTRSLSLGERERVLPIVEKQASIDVEIHFDYDSAAITDQAESQLASLARALCNSELKGALVLLGGHADAHGSDNYNQVLSERRAEAVKRYLVDKFQLPAENLATAGFGKRELKNKADPFAPENRRVQIANMAPTTEAKR